MKQQITLLVFLIVTFTSCSKDKIEPLKYPKTELINTTWKAFSFTAQVSREDIYQFIHFVSTTSVEIYSADITGSKLVGTKNTYPCKINLSDINADSFEITFPNSKVGVGFTTNDINKIKYDTNDYERVK